MAINTTRKSDPLQQVEFLTKEIMFTKRRGYLQVFCDHEARRLMMENNRDCVFLFLDYLRKKKKIKFNKREMKKIYYKFLS